MKYLYGDLTKARCQEDTLGVLRRVVDMSVEVLKLHWQTEQALQAIQAERNRLAQELEDIEKFQDDLRQTIQTSFSNRPQGHVVSDIGQAVTATLQQKTSDGKTRLSSQAEEKVRAIQVQVRQCTGATFEALQRFFLTSPLPATMTSLRCSLDGLGYRAESVVVDTAGFQCAYSLATARSEFFSSPKTFGSLVPGRTEIPVGTKKAFMRKEPIPELVRIEEAQLTEVIDGEKLGDYRLAVRTGNGVLPLLVRVAKPPATGCRVFRVSDPEPPQAIAPELFSAPQNESLIRFWTGLTPHLQALSGARENLTAIQFKGQDVVEGRLYALVVGQLVGYLAPFVREIDAHSVHPGELSLTIEHDEQGKREVFFVRKEKLLQKILELPEHHRKLFAPLGLDRGLPPPSAPLPVAHPPAAQPSAPQNAPATPSVIVEGGIARPGHPQSTPAISIEEANPPAESTDEISTQVVMGVLVKDEEPTKPGPKKSRP